MNGRPEYVILSPCTTSKTIEMRTRATINLKKAEAELSKKDEILANTSVFLTIIHAGKKFMVYRSGKIVIKEVDSKEGKPLLLEVFNSLKEGGCMDEN